MRKIKHVNKMKLSRKNRSMIIPVNQWHHRCLNHTKESSVELVNPPKKDQRILLLHIMINKHVVELRELANMIDFFSSAKQRSSEQC
jgi:hypothetical protein